MDDEVTVEIVAFSGSLGQLHPPSPSGMGRCDVCGKRDQTYVACSSMGAISFAYCADCLGEDVEPYGALLGGLMGVPREDIAAWALPIAERSLAKAGKTWEDFARDSKKLLDEYEEAMRR